MKQLSLLSELLKCLADRNVNKPLLGLLKTRLEEEPLAGEARFYYESILSRSPERGELATQKVQDRLGFALGVMNSNEFAEKHITIMRSLFPPVPAKIFIHVPKSGGTTVIKSQQQSGKYALFQTPNAITSGWVANRLAYYGDIASKLQGEIEWVGVTQHPTAKFIISHNIKQPHDQVFAIIRDPTDTVISYVNYIFTQLEMGLDNPNTRHWRSILEPRGFSRCSDLSEDILIEAVTRLIPKNLYCAALGNGTASSALDFVKRLNINLIRFEKIDEYLERECMPIIAPQNTSKKYICKDALGPEIIGRIRERIGEDLALLAQLSESGTFQYSASQTEVMGDQLNEKVEKTVTTTARENLFTSSELDKFVAKTDCLGPVGSVAVSEFWAKCEFVFDTFVDQELDPFSQAYVDQQVRLYEEISGRELDQSVNEAVAFSMSDHISAANPYAHLPAHEVGMHIARLSYALMNSGLAAKSHLLDLGCGWGLSSEFFAYSGLHVTALDISSSFVELVNTRAKQKNLTIEAVQGSFDNVPSGPFDAATYYECLHHAVKLWDALSSVARVIRPGGKVMIVGEPINNTWRHWGLRKDPLSIYCIRKFGWFESGWRLAFLQKCLDTCGFNLSYCAEAGEKIGWVIVAERRGYI